MDGPPFRAWVTLIEAAEVLGVKPDTLRQAANRLRNGEATALAQAGRLEIQRFPGGRDWLIPGPALERELARKKRGR